MSLGPITLFDKSVIHLLNFDEAALFGQFYRVNLTPMFFVETLADLTKEKGLRPGQTPEKLVEEIAAKTANLTFDPSAHHMRLVLGDLHGDTVLMDRRPHLPGGRHVTSEGKRGIVFAGSPEVDAFYRWQAGRFREIEVDTARGWRESLEANRIEKEPVERLFPRGRPKTLVEVKAHAEGLVSVRNDRAFLAWLDTLGVEMSHRGEILQRWLLAGRPPITEFAPYAAYVATVDLFFRGAVAADLISNQRASHAADIAYLYYLPFCMVFTSNDRLHAQTVPLFMTDRQQFVSGVNLKDDLRRLDEHFSSLPEEVRRRGVISFEPPDDDSYLTTRLWKRFLPGWRPGERAARRKERRPEEDAKIMEQFKAQRDAPPGPRVGADEADYVIIERYYPYQVGKWRIFPPEVEEGEKARRAAEAAKKAEQPPDPEQV